MRYNLDTLRKQTLKPVNYFYLEIIDEILQKKSSFLIDWYSNKSIVGKITM